MFRAIKAISALEVIVWGAALVQNAVRYFHGWGQNIWVIALGLVPILGIAVAVITFRLATRPAFAIAMLSALIAAAYLFAAETGVAN